MTMELVENKQMVSQNWTPEQLKLITNTVAKGATPDELKLFLYRCQNLGLDPLKPGQIYFIKYGQSPGTIVIGIEGFRSRAASTGKLAGIKRGAIRSADGTLRGAWAEVYRTDWKECAREEVPLEEYNTGKGNWSKMPETMIKKVAEAAALRMAFPDALGGVYTKEEMDQADRSEGKLSHHDTHTVYPDQPPEDGSDGDTIHPEYRIGFGKWKGFSVEEVYRKEGPDKLMNYIAYIETEAEKQGKTIVGEAALFIKTVDAYLGQMENRPLDFQEPGSLG